MQASSRTGRRALAVAATAALALAVPASGDDAGPAAKSAWGTATPAGEGAGASATARVRIRGFAYKPPRLVVRRGTRVVFANRDSARHTATRRGSFDTRIIRGGRSKAIRFKRRGNFRYLCTLHPFMRGRVVVR